jgi:hypothetical protein
LDARRAPTAYAGRGTDRGLLGGVRADRAFGVRLYLHGTVSPQVGLLRGRGEVEGRSWIPNPPSMRLRTSSSTSALSKPLSPAPRGALDKWEPATTVLDGARFETPVVYVRCATGRCSPPLLAAPACSGSRRPGPAPAKPSALAPPHPRAASAGARSPPPRALRSRLSSFISELASHEVPGFGAPALPSALGLKALASALAIARDHGVSASGRRWRAFIRRRGNLLAYQVPRRGHLYLYKGTRGARIVSARKGELMRSFRRAQVRACATWDEASRFIRRRRAD